MFKKPPPGDPRQGFFTDGDIAALLIELPAHLQPLTCFGHMTGWRLGECTGLVWDRIDWEREQIQLGPSQTKAKDTRYFPFAIVPGLKELLRTQWETRWQVCLLQQGRAKGWRADHSGRIVLYAVALGVQKGGFGR